MPGSIQYRGNNKYLLTVSAGFDERGKRKRFTKTVTAKSKAEAERELAIFYAEVTKGQIVDDKQITLGEYCDFWLEKRTKELSPKTIARYKQLLSRIKYALGDIRLSKLKPRHLADFYAMLREEGVRLDGKQGKLSETTITHHHRLLHTILESAYRLDRLIPENPADFLIDAPSMKRSYPKVYDDTQVGILLEKLKTAPIKYRTLIIITIFVGNRRGEVLGLEWEDIDEKENMIYIRRSSQYTVENGIYTWTTKTESSIRSVAVPPEVIELLRVYKAWWAQEKLKRGWQTNRLFVQRDGKPMHPDTPTKWFRRFLQEHNLPHITLHQLRHTNASILIANGVDIITVAERLGHSDKSTTARIYAHMLKQNNKKAANVLAKTLLKKPI